MFQSSLQEKLQRDLKRWTLALSSWWGQVRRPFLKLLMVLDNHVAYDEMANSMNPYGNGDTSKQIVNVFVENSIS